MAAVEVLERAGYEVILPPNSTFAADGRSTTTVSSTQRKLIWNA